MILAATRVIADDYGVGQARHRLRTLERGNRDVTGVRPGSHAALPTGSWLRVAAVALIAGWAGMTAGCASSGPSARYNSVRQIVEHDSVDALERVEAAMIELGLTIERRDPLKRELVTAPFDDDTRLRAGVSPQPPGTYARRRRVAIVRIDRGQKAGEVRVFCRVEVQEQTTQALRMLALDRAPSDVPDETPIQREAATTPAQNSVWQSTRRDLAAERAILQVIVGAANG